MRIIVFLLTLATAYSHRYSRFNKPSFVRASVESVTNYPFKNSPHSARFEDDRFRYYSPGIKKSNLIDYVFKSYGTHKVPLRDAVESLPVPILSAEQRYLLHFL